MEGNQNEEEEETGTILLFLFLIKFSLFCVLPATPNTLRNRQY